MAGLAVLPAFTLGAGYPRRLWLASVLLGVAGCASVAAVVLSDGPSLDWLAPAWAAVGSLLAWLSCRGHALDEDADEAAIAQARAKRAELGRLLAEHKARGSAAEREQKDTLALYGIIKSLGEALSWEQVRPKLEAAVEQYLGLNEFAFYAAASDGFKLIASRRLQGSPGTSWTTLARYLQERGLTAAHSFSTDNPEPGIGLPVVDNNEVLGYLYARVLQGQTPAQALGKAQGFAQQISFAFRRVKLFQEVQNLSQIDGLTGVHRRGGFEDRIRQETVRAKTFKTTVGLLLLDIDHFKKLNDRYGHPFGDQVLKRVGEILNASVYETDFVARYGGEEFVVLLPRAEPEGALRKAEAIRRAIEAEPFAIGFESVKVTVSIGLAHFPRDAATPEELISQADAAMYAAKSQGRNRVIDCRAPRS